jgi:hypothetical protein
MAVAMQNKASYQRQEQPQDNHRLLQMVKISSINLPLFFLIFISKLAIIVIEF